MYEHEVFSKVSESFFAFFTSSIAISHPGGTSSTTRRKRRTKSATSELLVIGKTLHALTGWKFTGEATSADLASAAREENMCEITYSTGAGVSENPAASIKCNPPLDKEEQLQRCLADDFEPDSNHSDKFLPMSGEHESGEHVEMGDAEDESMQSLGKQDNPSMVCLEQSTGSFDASHLTLEGLNDLPKLNVSDKRCEHYH